MTDATVFSGREEQSAHYSVSSRKWIAKGSDTYVKEFTLAPGEEVPWHHHSNVFDVFFCLEGSMTIERADAATRTPLDPFVLEVGQSAKVEVGTAHRPFNSGTGRCRFLIVQGIGAYDFLPYAAS